MVILSVCLLKEQKEIKYIHGNANYETYNKNFDKIKTFALSTCIILIH